MSAIMQASPVEKLAQEPLPTGDSCVLVIFGASGDLTKRKLIPGLYDLACEGCMNPQFEVLGIGRTPMSSEEFRKRTGRRRPGVTAVAPGWGRAYRVRLGDIDVRDVPVSLGSRRSPASAHPMASPITE